MIFFGLHMYTGIYFEPNLSYIIKVSLELIATCNQPPLRVKHLSLFVPKESFPSVRRSPKIALQPTVYVLLYKETIGDTTTVHKI